MKSLEKNGNNGAQDFWHGSAYVKLLAKNKKKNQMNSAFSN